MIIESCASRGPASRVIGNECEVPPFTCSRARALYSFYITQLLFIFQGTGICIYQHLCFSFCDLICIFPVVSGVLEGQNCMSSQNQHLRNIQKAKRMGISALQSASLVRNSLAFTYLFWPTLGGRSKPGVRAGSVADTNKCVNVAMTTALQ